MERYELEKLRDLPIEEVALQLGLQPNGHHKCLCPFHDDHHASLSFDQRRNTCRCFVCMDHSQGTIDLVMNALGKTFPEACQWLSDQFGIPIKTPQRGPSPQKPCNPCPPIKTCPKEAPSAPGFDATRYARFFEHPWLSDEARRFLFTQRRLSPAVIRWCRLTSWQDRRGTHWLEIPYFSADGHLIGLQNRNLDYRQGDAAPRFRFPYGARCSIYNLPVIAMLRPGEELYITEGASDCWAMLSAGHKAVAIPSATLLSGPDKRLLAELVSQKQTTLHMYPDRDTPGERLFMQLRDVLPSLQHHHLPQGCKDFGEAYAREML